MQNIMQRLVLCVGLLLLSTAASAQNRVVVLQGNSPVASTNPFFVTPVAGGTPQDVNVTKWSGGTLGVMANYGTSPGAVLVPGVNAFITNTPAVSESTTFAAVVSSSVIRVSNSTQYTANTGWCTLTSSCVTTFSWAGICRANGGSILIPNISVYSSANPTTKLQGILWLFSVVPGTIISDNATFNLASADFANLVGGSFNGIPFTLASSQASGASNSGVSLTGLNYEITCAGGSTTLYGMVQVVNTYTPVSAEVLTVRLHSVGLN